MISSNESKEATRNEAYPKLESDGKDRKDGKGIGELISDRVCVVV